MPLQKLQIANSVRGERPDPHRARGSVDRTHYVRIDNTPVNYQNVRPTSGSSIAGEDLLASSEDGSLSG